MRSNHGAVVGFSYFVSMQKLDFTAVDVVNRSDHCRVFSMPQMINVKRITD